MLSIGVLSDLIKAEIAATSTVTDDAELEKLTMAIATGVVNHFTADAVVTVTGVQSGGSSAVGTIS